MTSRIGRSFAVLVIACLVSAPALSDAVLVKDGVAQFGFVLPAEPTVKERLAADELRTYVQRMSSGVFKEVRFDAPDPKLYLGRAEAFPGVELPKGARALEPEEYLVAQAGGNLFVLGGDNPGVLWAVYEILHALGCRWYMPGPLGEVVPQLETLTLEDLPRRARPDFSYRQLWYSWGSQGQRGVRLADWNRRNRMAHPSVMHGHNLTASMPKEAAFEKRPELYALVQGERMPTQVCTSTPEVIDLITATVNKYFDRYPDALAYSLCPDDNTDFCECANCTALDSGRVAEGFDKPDVADRYVVFLNAVAKGIQDRHPGKMVSMYAYQNYSRPPLRTKISSHVVIFFTTSVYCSAHGIGDPNCASRMAMKRDLQGWRKACKNVYIYEYDPVPGNAELPFPLFGARTREMPVYRDMGIKGLSMEAHCSWATLTPNHWFTARLLFDADLKKDDLLRDFCRGFFGPNRNPYIDSDVADSMFRYYTALENAMASFPDKYEWGQLDLPQIYTPEVLSTCRGALDEAVARAKASVDPHDAVLQRLQMVEIGFHYLERYMDGRRIADEGGDFDEFQKAYTDTQEIIAQAIATDPDYLELNSALPGIKSGLGESIGLRFGSEVGLVTRWNAIGPFDNTGMHGHQAAYGPEADQDPAKSYVVNGNTVEWRVIEPPAGQGYVDLLRHFDPNEWVTIYTLAYLDAPTARDVQFRIGSNDTIKVWLNGRLVHQKDEGRAARFDDDIVPVHLEAGSNRVLLKVSNMGLKWGFYFRVTDNEGRADLDVKASVASN